MSSHNRILANLEEIVLQDDVIGAKEVEYANKTKTISEIDYLAYSIFKKHLDIYEVKSNLSAKAISKGKSQLRKHVDIFVQRYFPFDIFSIGTYLVTSINKRSNKPLIEQVNYFEYDCSPHCKRSEVVLSPNKQLFSFSNSKVYLK